MKKLYLIAILVTSLACEDTDDIPFEASSPLIVVEGWLTDQPALQYVRLSSTVKFSSSSGPVSVEDAVVTVYGGSAPIRYIHQGNGRYQTADSVFGISGRSYYLEVRLSSGDIIISDPEIMPSAPTIDSLGFDSFARQNPTSPQQEEIIFFPVAFTDDPAGIDNYYRWKIYRNDSLFNQPEDIFLFSDRFVDGNSQIPQEFISYDFKLNDHARLEIMEISEAAFQFLTELKSQITTIGTNAAVSPAPIQGNLRYRNSNNQVLGYFGATSINSAQKIVE